MKVRLTSNNTYTIFNNKEVSIGTIIQVPITNEWIASINGEIVATGNLPYIIHTLIN